MKNLPTLFYDKQELLLDIDIYGKIISTPQTSREDLANLLFEEFKFTHPVPTFEDERYKLSNLVSTDYKIRYDNELELQENESLVDLQVNGVSDDVVDIFKIEVPKELQDLFSYGKPVDEEYKLSLMEKFDLLDSETYNRGIATTEKLYGSVKEDTSLVLTDDEIDSLGHEQDEVYDMSFEDEDNDEEDFYDEVSDDYLDEDNNSDCEDAEDEEEYDLSSEDEDDLDESEEDSSYNDDEFNNLESSVTTSEEQNEQASEEDEEDDDFGFDDDEDEEEIEDDEDESEGDEEDEEDESEEEIEDEEDDDFGYEDESDDSYDEELDDESYDEEDEELDDEDDFGYDDSDEEDDIDDIEEESEESYYEEDDFGYDESEEEEDDSNDIEEGLEDDEDDDFGYNESEKQSSSNYSDTTEEDFDIEFVDEPIVQRPVEPKPRPAPLTENRMFGREVRGTESSSPPKPPEPRSSEFGDDEPKELRAFLKKHPRCEMSVVLRYFSKKEVETQIRLGKVIKRGNTLRI